MCKLQRYAFFMIWIVFALNLFGCNRHFSLTGKPTQYLSTVYKEEAVILESRIKSPWTCLYYITKRNGEYETVQTLNLNSFMRENGPSMVVFNEKWLVIGNRCERKMLPPYLWRPYGGRVYVFKKVDGLWKYHIAISNPLKDELSENSGSNFGQQVGLNGDMLLCSYSCEGDEAIYSYSLNEGTPKQVQVIRSPFKRESNDNLATFGLEFYVSNGILLVIDSTRLYHKDGTKQVDDYLAKCEKSTSLVPLKMDICVYHLQNNTWEFDTSVIDCYRKETKDREESLPLINCDIPFYPYTGVDGDMVYIRGKIVNTQDKIDFVFKRDENNHLHFVSAMDNSEVLKNNTKQQRCIPGRYSTDRGSEYHIVSHFGIPTINLYPPANIEKNLFYSEPVHSIDFISDDLLQYQDKTEIETNISIGEKLMITCFSFPDAFSWFSGQNDSPIYGRIQIYELQDKKIKEVYRMETNKWKNLSFCSF